MALRAGDHTLHGRGILGDARLELRGLEGERAVLLRGDPERREGGDGAAHVGRDQRREPPPDGARQAVAAEGARRDGAVGVAGSALAVDGAHDVVVGVQE